MGITLEKKIFGGLITLILVVVAVVGSYHYILKRTVSEYEYLSETGQKLLEHNDHAKIYMLQSRRNEKDFILRKNEKYLKKHKETMKYQNCTVRMLHNCKFYFY